MLKAGAPPLTLTLTATSLILKNDSSLTPHHRTLPQLTHPSPSHPLTPVPQTLFGFERVHVKAGQTVTVSLAAGLSDFATVGADGQHVALPGTYTAHFGVRESLQHGMGFAEHTHFTV